MFFNFQLSESSDNVPLSDHLKHPKRRPHRFRPLNIPPDPTVRPDNYTSQPEHTGSRPPDPPTRSDHPTANQIRPPEQTSTPDNHP